MKNDRVFVYVLKCAGGCWYVGSTNNIEARMCEHFAGTGALWTQKWPPVSVVEAIECHGGDPLPLERAKTVEYCMRYSWQHVRCVGHVRVDASQPARFGQDGCKRRARNVRPPTVASRIEDGLLCRFINTPEEQGVSLGEAESGDNGEMATTITVMDPRRVSAPG